MNQPLAQQAYGKIIEMILSGTLMPGDALQEAKLGETLDMSRTPVREAIKRIEAEGLAEQDGRFLKVRTLTAAEVEEIFFLRGVLESYCIRQATSVPVTLLDELEKRVRHLQRHGPGEEDEQRRVDDDLHRTFALSSRSEVMVSTIADLRRRTCMFDHSNLPHRFLKSCEEHLEMLDAVRAGDAGRAGILMAEHITRARDAILERLALSPERTAE
ncbi:MULTISPECIES: GntR family transcriptional regulator [Rhizobium]|uniref:DNA-binding transcriptional regulator, GntR family n=1 Tax=Rhizobium lusitanum TaxID=293958 RepID=A0A1C3XGK0_9HYPH|nr:GntR family transcriptional regulator [Rhizobium lusitanum]SCB51400.1 DNA-binding transcriptional regulator, GntR family [Rhizobium lusitanum]